MLDVMKLKISILEDQIGRLEDLNEKADKNREILKSLFNQNMIEGMEIL